MGARPSSVGSWSTTGGLLLILAVAAALRFRGLDDQSLWLDETFSVALARDSTARLLDQLVTDVHPPLYFLLLKVWLLVAGASSWAARSLSVVASVGGVCLTFLAGRRLFDRQTGLVAAFFVAVSPFQIAFGQEVRMYALLALLATAATLVFVALGEPSAPAGPSSDGPRRMGRLLTPAWWGYAALATALLYTHAVGVFVLVAHGVTATAARLGAGRRDAARAFERWFTALLASVLAFLPWLPTFGRQFMEVQRGFWIPEPGPSELVGALSAFAGTAWLATILGAAAVVGLFGPSVRRRAGPWPLGTLMASWAVVPIAAPFAASVVGAPIFLPKYTIAASIPLALLAAAGLARLPMGRVATAVGAGLAVVGLLAAPTATKDDWRGAMSRIGTEASRDDVVLFYPYFLEYPWRVYQPRPDVEARPFPKHAPETTTPTLASIARDLTGRRRRVWLVLMAYDPRHDAVVGALRAEYTTLTRFPHGHVAVWRLDGRRAD